MKKMKLIALGSAAVFCASQFTVSQAAILTFDTGQASNADLSLTFGSNLSADIAGANISNGTTPDIGLTWAPSPNVLEVHGSTNFDPLDPGSSVVDVLQLDLNGGEADPTLTFVTAPSVALQLNSLLIGHALDMTELANAWTLTISEAGGGPQVFTHTTEVLGAGGTEVVTFDFTGNLGVDYVLKFDDGGANHIRGAIDNLSFSQIDQVEAQSGTVIEFNGISGSNNTDIPETFGSNLSGNIPGVTVIGDGTPGIALTWAGGGADRWELHGSGNSYWSALDSAGPTSSTPTVGQIENGSPQPYIDFTVADGSQLVLNSVDLGMATDKTDTYNFTITIAEVGGAVVATYTPPAMDGDGSSGVMAQTVNLSFTGDPGVNYRLQFEDSPDTNGGAIDNLSFSQIVVLDDIPPELSASNPLTPAAGSTNVSLTTDFVVTFHENITLGIGNIVIRRLDDDSVVETIDVNGGNVLVDGAQVTITPSMALAELLEFYVEIAAGSFVDLVDNPFAGFSGPDTWYFTTIEALRLQIVVNGSDLDFWWNSSPGKVYDLLSTTNLLIPLDSWLAYDPDGVGGNDPYEDISFDGTITVPSVDSCRFFALEEKKAPVTVLVAAHRGDSINAPENTVASIDSMAPGIADLTEFDVQVTADGALVLMHDTTVDRTTDGTGSVASMTLAAIQALDAGSWFSSAFIGEPVPTLAAAINAAITNGIEPLIERKTGDAAVYHAEFVALALTPNDFRVISFNAAFLNELDTLNPAYRLGLLGSDAITQAVIDQAKANGADFLSWNNGAVDQAAVDLVYANGMELMVWTINDAGRMQELIDLGVGGITTDNPTLLRSLLP